MPRRSFAKTGTPTHGLDRVGLHGHGHGRRGGTGELGIEKVPNPLRTLRRKIRSRIEQTKIPRIRHLHDAMFELRPISLISATPLMLVGRTTLPPKDATDLIAWLKANPGKASAATVGAGSAAHVCLLYLQQKTATSFQLVPYRSGAPVMQDLISGQIDMFCAEASQTLSFLRAGGAQISRSSPMTQRGVLQENVQENEDERSDRRSFDSFTRSTVITLIRLIAARTAFRSSCLFEGGALSQTTCGDGFCSVRVRAGDL